MNLGSDAGVLGPLLMRITGFVGGAPDGSPYAWERLPSDVDTTVVLA